MSDLDKKFKEMFPDRVVKYDDFFDRVFFHAGSFTIEELEKIVSLVQKTGFDNREVKRIQNLKVKGFTIKDIKVQYFHLNEDDKKYHYSFYIMKDGKDWDFYYGHSDQGAGDWWPDQDEDSIYLPKHFNFIPEMFQESCENMYVCPWPDKKVIDFLKKCGFTVEASTE